MPDILGGDIQALFFLVLRLLAAVGGFLAGWILGGPAAMLLARLAFHRPLPAAGKFFSKLAGGLLVGLAVFWYLVFGPGGGGGGRGGGTGPGVGPGKNGSGPTKSAGQGESADKGGPAPKSQKGTQRLNIELLGGDAVKDGKFYLIGRENAPVDGAALKEHLEKVRHTIGGVDIIVTNNSVGESHQAYRYLLQLALDYDLRPSIVSTGKQK